VDISLEAGLNMFDTADIYSAGLAEEILGKAIAGRRDQVIVSTKASFRTGPGPNDIGSSRFHLIKACEASLRRLGTDYVDLYQLHGFDALTDVDEALRALDDLVRAGKVRYIGCSNFSGWHLMKALATSDRYGLARYVAHHQPLARHRQQGSAGGRGVPLPCGRCDRRHREGDGEERAADRHQLAAAAAHRVERDHRRSQRGAATPEPRRRRLESGGGAGGSARRGQRDDTRLSLLAPAT
jgi:hypothetical protein